MENEQDETEILLNSDSVTYEFGTPVKRGSGDKAIIINQTIIKKPGGSAFRGGLTTQAIAQGEVDSLAILLPRITSPQILTEDVYNMPFDEITIISGILKGFLYQSKGKLVSGSTT